MPTTITSRERILRGMRGQPIDRVATAPRMWKFIMSHYGGRYAPEAEMRAAEEFGYDSIFYTGGSVPSFLNAAIPAPETLPEGVTCQGETESQDDCDIVRRRFHTPAGPLSDAWRRPHPNKGYGISPSPSHIEYLVKGPGDIERLRYLSAAPSPGLIKRFTDVTAQFGERGLVTPYVRSPGNDLSYVFSSQDALMLPYDNPQLLRDLLAFFQEACLADIRAHLAAGADTIFVSGFHISLSVGWSPQMFRDYFLPLVSEEAAVTHDGGAVFHYYDDGRMMAILDMILEAGVDVFSTCTPPPAGDCDLREAKARTGRDMSLMGYVDIENVLHRGTPEQVDATVREAIETGAADDRFVLSSSDGVLTQTPLENLRAYFAAARKYGQR